jgi:hypothetical protein
MDNDPFLEGVQAYDCYECLEDNPYPPLSDNGLVWERGWRERKHGYVDEYGFYKDDDDD